MHLAFVILSTAAQAGPLRIPGQWNCRGAVEWPTMQQLKRQTGMLLRSTILPSRILGVSMSRSYLLLLNQNECPAARWTMELLLAEQGMTRQQADRDFSDLAKDLGRDNDHFPFVAFFGGRDEGSLFHELFWGAGPAWSSVSLGGWSTFALIGRLSLAFQVHLMEHGQPSKASYQELLTLQHATRRRACCATARTPRPRSCQIAGNKCVRVVDSPCSSSCRSRRVIARVVQKSSVERHATWTDRSIFVNRRPVTGPVECTRQGAAAGLRADLPPATLSLELEVFPQCRARHCTKYWGPDDAGAAAARTANRNSARGLTMFHIG